MRPDAADLSFAILGRRLRASSPTPRLAQWLRASWDRPEHHPPDHAFVIDLECLAAPPRPSGGDAAPCAVAVQGRRLPFVSTGAGAGAAWELREEGAGLRLDLGERGARVGLWGLDDHRDPAPLYLGLQVVLSEALRASGLMPLHAAVAARADVAVAWLGGSGTGKSSTLLRAARAGWRAVAEDLSWLEPESRRVWGWDRGIRVWPETLERFFPEYADAPALPDGKRDIPYERLGGGPARSCTLTHLVLLRRDEGTATSRREAVPARDTVRALWEAAGVPLSDAARQASGRAIARLSGLLPASRWVLGRQPPADADGWFGYEAGG
jgi:hypothetical protein